MPDFIGNGEFWTLAICFWTVSGVKSTCLAAIERSRLGVVGTEGSALSRSGLVGLLVRVGIEDGVALGFFMLELGYLRINLTRSSFPGLRKKLLGSDFGRLLRLLVVADFVKPRGVPPRVGFDGDLDTVRI